VTEDETSTQAPGGLGRHEDLTSPAVIAETRRQVRDRASRREGPALTRDPPEPDQPHIALAGADADVDRDRWMGVFGFAVSSVGLVANREGSADSSGRVVLGLSGLEEDHEAVAGGLVDVTAFRADVG
jgi:hypothetical protein